MIGPRYRREFALRPVLAIGDSLKAAVKSSYGIEAFPKTS
jgi:hypothetical protein